VALHLEERIVGYCAGKGYVWFDAPVPFIRKEGGVVVEETKWRIMLENEL
jgi:hypothetical protein